MMCLRPGLWDDELIATARIPREKVLVQQLISRGGYGEVYYGLFNGQQVAIKMLLPKSRKSVKHVNDFLAEVKLMATMDHPCIVQFVGVAWDSLTDLCVVSEYMEGGDLRALLSSYEAQNYKLGFDRTKVIIALHVAHALTYLHSLNPPVLHRDLKSKNILMSSNLEAKVTDFGISRERVDQTMTAGVGTSLWMAPEMMMGERYDDKADMFSFGVVLSELDQHSLPYSHAKDNNSGRKLPDTAILQMVTLGQIRVEFSSEALESMVQLGMACVSVDPKDRPTAAEALYKLQNLNQSNAYEVSDDCVVASKRRSNKNDSSSEVAPTPSKHHDANGYAVLTSPTTGYNKSIDSEGTDFSSSLGLGPRSLAGLWDDEVIATARIPRHKVLVHQLINRGGYGEVYYGLFNGESVAVKMLFPEVRKSVKHVNDFLDEVRMMTKLNHPRIVRFVGIAWDSLTDLCVVSEYMEGGDLRALLSLYEDQGYDLGFDSNKVTIALHIAHALAYLHSLTPPVIHRDLKSKNVLLSSGLEAKVTDFGISRERVDQTMTAGVGTSLWMAPEMMMGERYDDKADMFSFGVVLSELDQHSLPYSHAKDNNSGRKLPDTAILQMVTLGQIRVEFSSEALESMVQLGMACVSVDPKDRPTAAEALYKLQVILRQELEVSPDEYQTTEA
ncbi:hypothetical protein BBI17_002347 [Phytophthora kernoviae]|uniref:Protein kinase domain-containing protein n=1 Tax=Phytophthora kernoviae TaxID=325452 RepID=A0A3R7H017_9STRA|nr:hypothetical protein BBI17_002347 [Phytophthora kernoviae]